MALYYCFDVAGFFSRAGGGCVFCLHVKACFTPTDRDPATRLSVGILVLISAFRLKYTHTHCKAKRKRCDRWRDPLLDEAQGSSPSRFFQGSSRVTARRIDFFFKPHRPGVRSHQGVSKLSRVGSGRVGSPLPDPTRPARFDPTRKQTRSQFFRLSSTGGVFMW